MLKQLVHKAVTSAQRLTNSKMADVFFSYEISVPARRSNLLNKILKTSRQSRETFAESVRRTEQNSSILRAVSQLSYKLFLSETSSSPYLPDTTFKRLALLCSILEVAGSNLGSENGYPYWGYSRLSSVIRSKCGDITSNYATMHFLSHSLFNNHPIIRHYRLRAIDSSIQNTTHQYTSSTGLSYLELRYL